MKTPDYKRLNRQNEQRDFVRMLRKALRDENRKRGDFLERVPPDQWPLHSAPPNLVDVMRSRWFLVQLYCDDRHHLHPLRMGVNRTSIKDDGNWEDGIAWDELMELKRQAGFAERWAVEIYPPDNHIINAANIRWLWLLDEAPAYAWRNLPPKFPSTGESQPTCCGTEGAPSGKGVTLAVHHTSPKA